MADKKPPILVKPISPQIVNEGASFGPFNLNDFVESPDAVSGVVRFTAELSDGRSLPKGLICTTDGMISGIPASGTSGVHEVKVTAQNDSDLPFTTMFNFTIKERTALDDAAKYFTDLKSKIWEAVGQDLPLPELTDFLSKPITEVEIYYLLQRYATLIIWDVYNMDPPGVKHLLTLPENSPHYNIYDRGSCLVACPKDLYSYERTLEDALQAARVMAREAYQRNWTIEFAGFSKMARAAWVELQILGEHHGKAMEILHYTPTDFDHEIYKKQAVMKKMRQSGV